MKPFMVQTIAASIAVLLLAACCPMQPKPAPVQNENVVPLGEAIKQIQKAVSDSRDTDAKMGTVVNKVTISLKVTAASTDAQGRAATIGVALTPITLGGSASDTLTRSSASENTITLEFDNPLLAGKDTVLATMAGVTEPAKFNAALHNLITILSLPPTGQESLKGQ